MLVWVCNKMSRSQQACEAHDSIVHGLLFVFESHVVKLGLITYQRMRRYVSVWRKRMALVAMKLTRSRHVSAQDGE